MYRIDSLSGLTIEALFLMPVVACWLGWQTVMQPNSLMFGRDLQTTLLLIGSGCLTAVPLVLFAMATARVNLSVVGFIQYINPTMQLSLGVLVLGEQVSPSRLLTIAIVCVALIVFMIGVWQMHRPQPRFMG
jgi:chloramphenicol-sensitive protein RarD